MTTPPWCRLKVMVYYYYPADGGEYSKHEVEFVSGSGRVADCHWRLLAPYSIVHNLPNVQTEKE